MFLIILIGIIVTIAFLLRQSKFYKLASKLPCAKGLPLLGHTFNIWVDKNGVLDKMNEIVNDEENKKILSKAGVLSLWVGPMVIVLIDNLPDIEQIMVSQKLSTKAYQYKFFEPWLGKGLFTSSGLHWYKHRKLLSPAFHFKILEKFIPVFNSNIEIYLNKLDSQVGIGSFNIQDYVALLSLDIIAETAMSAKINAQMQECEYAHKVKDLTETILLRSFRILYYPDFIFNLSTLGKKQKEYKKYVDDFIINLINQKKQERSKSEINKDLNNSESGKTRVALMDLLLDSQSKASFNDKEVLDEVNTFMFGGHDTITSGTNFTLYLLSRHPTIQDEVLNEIMDVVGNDNFTLHNLQELKYLERVIKESLRILPVAPFIVRAVKQDTHLKSGYTIPAGCSIILFIYRLHRNPELYPNPEQFDPDRFLPENSSKRHPFAYLPFSAGPRNCIGQKFAILEMKAIIAATIRRFKLLQSGEEVKPVAHITLRSANGINVALERRQ